MLLSVASQYKKVDYSLEFVVFRTGNHIIHIMWKLVFRLME